MTLAEGSEFYANGTVTAAESLNVNLAPQSSLSVEPGGQITFAASISLALAQSSDFRIRASVRTSLASS